MTLPIIILGLVGLILSAYGYIIEKKAEKDSNYKAVCDINDTMSCTQTFTSQYGKTFGISNTLSGIFFYALITVLGFFSNIFVFLLAILAILFSIYLGYLQYFKLKKFCVICTSIYIVNILILILA